MIYERCCTTVEQVRDAKLSDLDRAELCFDLTCGGVTPDESTVRGAVLTGLPVNVLVRPRAGGFTYDEAEAGQMMESIEMCARCGAAGVVIGALTPQGSVDMPLMTRLVGTARSHSLSVTFHRAFDECCDPESVLEQVISLGCDRLLTSGCAPSAWEGREMLARLASQAAGRIIIMPGAGVTRELAGALADYCGLSEFHGTRL